MDAKAKYEINLDKPLMLLSYALLGYLLIRAYAQKNLFDLILFGVFFTAMTILVGRDYKTYRPFIVKANVQNT